MPLTLMEVMKRIVLIVSSTTLALILSVSCSREKLDPVCDGTEATYTDDVKSIIDNSCAKSGCHGSGSGRGDFTSYAGLQPYLDNGVFESEVLIQQSMPRGGSLSQADINTIQCWLENSYAE